MENDMLKTILEFIGGKTPDIFDESGQVRHKLPSEKWQAWDDRYKKSPEFNWRNHTGIKANSKKRVQ
jgi:hypothetical protein